MREIFSLIALAACVAGPCLTTPVSAAPDESDTSGISATEDRVIELPSDKRHKLWIPKGYEHQGNVVDVLIDFHGSPRIVRESTRSADLNCVVISVNYGGFSSVYRKPFSADRQLLQKILDETLVQLREQEDFADDVAWGRLAVSSFSAGFGAVRELLKSPEYFERIEGIYLVDSLYCGYVGDGTDEVVDGVVHPGLMKDFLRFAKLSTEGKKVMIVTHCDGPTPGYASTRETADYLLDNLRLEPEAVDRPVKLAGQSAEEVGKFRLYRQAERQGFFLYGSPGPNEADHVQHMLHMALWLPKLPLAKQGGEAK